LSYAKPNALFNIALCTNPTCMIYWVLGKKLLIRNKNKRPGI